MVEVRKVDRSMFPQVYPLLLEFDNQQLTEEDWRRFYDYPWATDEGYCGYALLSGEAVVGFIAMIFSERLIDGRVERFCNLANWIVKDEYRGQSLALLLPALKLAGYTLTDFTPSPQVREISQRLGFRPLDARLKLLLPMPRLPFGGRGAGWQVTTDVKQIEHRLRPPELRILQDHRRTPCHHLLLYDEHDYCYVIFCVLRTNKYPLRYSCIHFISNRALFALHSDQVRAAIIRQSKSPLVVVDSRLVAGLALPWSVELPVKEHRLYKSETVQPEQIDNLYSELILANVSVLPSVRSLFAPLKRLLRGEKAAGLRSFWPMRR